MTNSVFDVESLVGLAIVGILLWVTLGAIAYVFSKRGAKASWFSFLGRYSFCFFSLFFLESLVIYIIWPGLYYEMRSVTATVVGGMLDLTGASHSVSGPIITVHNPYLSFDVTSRCLAGMLLWMWVALVVAESNITIKQRLRGILLGIVVIVLFNFVRIMLSVYLEWRTGVRVHDYFMGFNAIFVVLIWIVWVRLLKRGPPANATRSPSTTSS